MKYDSSKDRLDQLPVLRSGIAQSFLLTQLEIICVRHVLTYSKYVVWFRLDLGGACRTLLKRSDAERFANSHGQWVQRLKAHCLSLDT